MSTPNEERSKNHVLSLPNLESQMQQPAKIMSRVYNCAENALKDENYQGFWPSGGYYR
jgi:hypothetical protein